MIGRASPRVALLAALLVSVPALHAAATGRLDPADATLRFLVALLLSMAAVGVVGAVVDGYRAGNGGAAGEQPPRRRHDDEAP